MNSNSMDDARELLELVIPYLTHGDDGCGQFEFWIDSREEVSPGIRACVPVVAREALNNSNSELICSAIQALAVTGDESDIPLMEPLVESRDAMVAQDAMACIKHIRFRMISIEQLLQEVTDRESFLTFASALAEESDRAEVIERDNPHIYIVDGALGWMNRSIGEFIGAGLTHFEPAPGERPIETPTWKDIAKFLYRGKIIE